MTSDPPLGLAGRAAMLVGVAGASYAGGALLHSAKALLGSGEGRRLAAAAAKSGRSFALTGAALCGFDFLFASLRGTSEDDAATVGLAGAATAGLAMARHGPLVAGFSSVAVGSACAIFANDLFN